MTGAIVAVLLILVYSLPCAFIAADIKRKRGGEYRDGFILGLFLGVFGVMIAASS